MKKGEGKPLETARQALEVIEESERDYAQQAKKMQDTEVAALLEAIRMFHANSAKKLKEYINSATNGRPASGS
ncbi:MAG: hypothetical protein JW950_08950 [Deltaproteobacteria bacterium]|nr:hypothetical protein [Deltaproteobacteria bacterium]